MDVPTSQCGTPRGYPNTHRVPECGIYRVQGSTSECGMWNTHGVPDCGFQKRKALRASRSSRRASWHEPSDKASNCKLFRHPSGMGVLHTARWRPFYSSFHCTVKPILHGNHEKLRAWLCSRSDHVSACGAEDSRVASRGGCCHARREINPRYFTAKRAKTAKGHRISENPGDSTVQNLPGPPSNSHL